MTIKQILHQYAWLIATIYQAGNEGITIKELSNKWQQNSTLSGGENYARRTFNNHREEIYDIFGITIDCDRRTNRYYIPDYDIEKDAQHFKKWLLDCAVLNNLFNESSDFKSKIIFENESGHNRWLAYLAHAIEEQTKIHIEYSRLESSDTLWVKYAEPLALKQFQQRWHLLCRRADQKLILYELDKIQAIKLTKAHFQQPEDFDAQQYFENHYGVLISDEIAPQKILLKVTEEQAFHLRNRPLHHSQKEGEQKNGFVLFEYFLAPTSDFLHALLAQGATIEVLKPSELRQAISETAEAIHKQNRWFQKKSVSLQRNRGK